MLMRLSLFYYGTALRIAFTLGLSVRQSNPGMKYLPVMIKSLTLQIW